MLFDPAREEFQQCSLRFQDQLENHVRDWFRNNRPKSQKPRPIVGAGQPGPSWRADYHEGIQPMDLCGFDVK